MLIVVCKRLVVLVYAGHIGIGKDVGQNFQLVTLLQFQFAIGFAYPAAFVDVLVFPLFGVAHTWFGFHIVEPGIFHAITTGPHIFTSDGASMAAYAFVEVQHHADLCSDFHIVFLIVTLGFLLAGRVNRGVHPVHFFHFAHHHKFIAVGTHRTVVIEAPRQLSITTNHVGGFQDGFGH